ncbi:hypothetical protein [Glycomyces sp. NPDC047010]|uniref:hypothetical protein n=1 Tax=Glycomyces sp. NPDC047010 TaxID=3155023 RepID=UPI0033D54209
MGAAPDPPFVLEYRPHAEDDSWSPGWVPAPAIPGRGGFEGWEEIPETEFVFYRFQVDIHLDIGGNDFSAVLNPVLDFALAWQYLPGVLDEQGSIDTSMSVQGLTYRVERDGGDVVVSSNVHPKRRSARGFTPHRARLSRADFEALVDQIVEGAFRLLYEAHPELERNHYLNGLRERIGF